MKSPRFPRCPGAISSVLRQHITWVHVAKNAESSMILQMNTVMSTKMRMGKIEYSLAFSQLCRLTQLLLQFLNLRKEFSLNMILFFPGELLLQRVDLLLYLLVVGGFFYPELLIVLSFCCSCETTVFHIGWICAELLRFLL